MRMSVSVGVCMSVYECTLVSLTLYTCISHSLHLYLSLSTLVSLSLYTCISHSLHLYLSLSTLVSLSLYTCSPNHHLFTQPPLVHPTTTSTASLSRTEPLARKEICLPSCSSASHALLASGRARRGVQAASPAPHVRSVRTVKQKSLDVVCRSA
jgi:hypothetical protein